GVVYGPVIGAITGIVLVSIHLLMSGYFGIYFLWVIPEYALAGWLAAQWSSQGILQLGMTITLLLHGINIIFSLFFRRHMIFQYMVYAATNVVFNFALFALAGPAVIGVLK
ncbi:hypothetical protein HY546_03185, partial [archaeon]|nr:hypothetical protein [archaeon]